MSQNQSLFQNPAIFESNDWPKIVSQRRNSPDSVIIEILVQKEVSWFTGHFPGTPVLAGVVQTHWAAEFGRDLFSLQGEGIQLDNIKFSEVVLPDTQCLLELQHDPQTNRVSFRYYYEDHLYSSGRIRFL